MNPNPASDIFAFLTKPAWYTAAFWVLMIASAAIAAYVAARIPEQRKLRHIGAMDIPVSDRGDVVAADAVETAAILHR